MEYEGTYICAYCLQINTILVDPTEGPEQDLVEDCQVCCRPNQLHITVNEELEEVNVDAAIL